MRTEKHPATDDDRHEGVPDGDTTRVCDSTPVVFRVKPVDTPRFREDRRAPRVPRERTDSVRLRPRG